MSSEQKINYDLKRFAGIKRDYTEEEVERLRGSLKIEYSISKQQSLKLWNLLNSEDYINTLGTYRALCKYIRFTLRKPSRSAC